MFEPEPADLNEEARLVRDNSMTPIRLHGANAPDPIATLVADAIATAGPARVLRAALLAFLRPPARPPDAANLPARLRRDIGLADGPTPLPTERLSLEVGIGAVTPTLPGQMLR